MATEDRVAVDERYKYRCKMKTRYVNANPKEQGRLLNEIEEATGLYRKSLIRFL
jgi:hypothetical protein